MDSLTREMHKLLGLHGEIPLLEAVADAMRAHSSELRELGMVTGAAKTVLRAEQVADSTNYMKNNVVSVGIDRLYELAEQEGN